MEGVGSVGSRAFRGLGFWGLGVSGLGCRVRGFGFCVWSVGFRVWGGFGFLSAPEFQGFCGASPDD